MKQYNLSCTAYSLDELSEKAQARAFSKWLAHTEYFNTGEIEATLNEFCRLFDVKCNYWEFDAYSHSFRFKILNDAFDDENMNGIRLAKYIWNNYAKYIMQGKYFSLWSKTEKSENNPLMGKLKSRRSKVLLSMDDCPLTGVCFDCDVLSGVVKCLTYKKLYDSYEEIIDECLESLFKTAEQDCEYQISEEYFREEAAANDYEYDENGNVFSIPPCAYIA